MASVKPWVQALGDAMPTIMPLVQALIVGFLTLMGIVLTQAWTGRREHRKRRVDMAEEVLALCYEAEDAIRFIRSPAVWAGEGGTRHRGVNEKPEESKALDTAYIVIERYNKCEATFKNLKAMKYVFMAMFRGNAHNSFGMIDQVISKLLMASNILGIYYWPRMSEMRVFGPAEFVSQEQRDQFLKAMHDQEAVFYSGLEPDPITPVMAEAVRTVEAITDKAAKEYVACTKMKIW